MSMTESTPYGVPSSHGAPKARGRVIRAVMAVSLAVWLPMGGWDWLVEDVPQDRWWTAERGPMSDKWRAEHAASAAKLASAAEAPRH